MEVFIVRPFGKKPASRRDKNTGKIIEELDLDFNKVEKDLIVPALEAEGLTGGTTMKIFEAGDIRLDMFTLLLTADIVIADITIHNANVFYELGIRHALRDQKTILLKCPGFDDTPFDILGYRYVSYASDDPAAALNDLISSIRQTRSDDRKDSPVFNVLPKLEPQDPEKLLAIPPDFTEEVEIAFSNNDLGRLILLAAEVESFLWKIPAWRLIGAKVREMDAMEAGLYIWEKIKNNDPGDIQANDMLATIYQRLGEKRMTSSQVEGISLLTQSDMAIKVLLENPDKNDRQHFAEAFSLKGRNEKTRWILSWKKSPQADWPIDALKSDFLFDAYESYTKAYYEDLNHYYSGINCLGLLTVIIELGKAHPDIWGLRFENKEEANRKLDDLAKKLQEISISVRLSLEAAKSKLKDTGKTNPWLEITEADLACLTSKNPAKVGLLYHHVLEESGKFNLAASIRQLKIYEQLGVLPDNVKAALKALEDNQPAEKQDTVHTLLFTGHMIDKPSRPVKRFPPGKKKEDEVRQKIENEIIKIKQKTTAKLTGIAGGACGGDTLFHEICEKHGIPTEVYLALPRDKFIVESVQFAGPEWIDRFDAIYLRVKKHILSQNKDMPGWLSKKEKYNIWERNNLWELNSALVNGGINMTLLALWDNKGGDGPGGTADMVKEAKARGAKTIIISI